MPNYVKLVEEMRKMCPNAGFSDEEWKDTADRLVKIFHILYQADREHNITGYWEYKEMQSKGPKLNNQIISNPK